MCQLIHKSIKTLSLCHCTGNISVTFVLLALFGCFDYITTSHFVKMWIFNATFLL